jgi:hypothetical protein
MCIISRKTLKEFWDQHPDEQQPLQAWYNDAKHDLWKFPTDIKNAYHNSSGSVNPCVSKAEMSPLTAKLKCPLGTGEDTNGVEEVTWIWGQIWQIWGQVLKYK